jgi:integrase
VKHEKPAPSVFPKGKWWYLVVADGKRRIWHKLSRIADGLPALYTALAAKKAELSQPDGSAGKMPELISRWEREVMPAHKPKTQRDDQARGKVIAEAFVEFLPGEVDTPACDAFLSQFKSKPRTFNAYRAQLREYMRFTEIKGERPPGSNPVLAIRTMATPARGRYITDSELRRIKVAAMRATDRWGNVLDTRSGPMLCALIDMAYLTGQAISDLLSLEWSNLRRDGIFFARSKVDKTTGAKVTIGWTPKLRDVEQRLKALRKERRAFGAKVFVRQDGQPLTYWGASSAWQDARRRAGITGCTFHDLKAKALTDKDEREGMGEAMAMGQHATEGQTAAYIRHRRGRKTSATR